MQRHAGNGQRDTWRHRLQQPGFAPQRRLGLLAFGELEDQPVVDLDREAVPAFAGDREIRVGEFGKDRFDGPAQFRRDRLRWRQDAQ
ncbi:hypothetical protein [Mesorhizobium sp. J428]|uniref:hypothetical protein n=1 Tax=Mesorhizobium sp. J428 TaxID=2898440 RepID=UPI0021511C4C|nr:hypothetical protein [Mesorhizobium sp. J428]MCR5856088.1 hypothetical protein [Mesorhizobium sp. J428]